MEFTLHFNLNTKEMVKSALKIHFYSQFNISHIFSIGVHPHDAKSMVEEDLWASLKSIAMAPECVAIGECGLDYGKDFSEPAVQRDIFTKQVTTIS